MNKAQVQSHAAQSRKDELTKGGLLENKGIIVWQYLTQEQKLKSIYKGSVYKNSLGNYKQGKVFGTIDLKK